MLGVGSPEAAAAAAAYGVLAALYGADDPCLAAVTNPAVTYAGDLGLQAGNEAAAALLLLIARRSRCRRTPSPAARTPVNGARLDWRSRRARSVS